MLDNNIIVCRSCYYCHPYYICNCGHVWRHAHCNQGHYVVALPAVTVLHIQLHARYTDEAGAGDVCPVQAAHPHAVVHPADRPGAGEAGHGAGHEEGRETLHIDFDIFR